MTELMTIDEVSHYLKVTKTTIYRMLKQGKFPAVKIGNRWRFDKEALEAWLNGNKVGVSVTILVIDDEKYVQLLIKRTLEEFGHKVITTGDALEGLELVKQLNLDLVFLDLKMPGMDGAEVFAEIRKLKPGLQVTIITGYPDSDLMSRVMVHGPFGVMNKPFTESDIVGAINSFLRINN